MKNIRQIQQQFQESLQEIYPVEEIKQLFLLSYTHVSGKKAIQYAMEGNGPISDSDLKTYESLLDELKSGRPMQHILGEAPFYGLNFSVNEHTLIPRPETEELVDLIIKDNLTKGPIDLVDIGTGSGCIAISLAKALPNTSVSAIEISGSAIEIARQNAKRHEVEVNFINADIAEWDYFLADDQLFDVIVSNPPYITVAEKADMHSNVLQYEPHSALFVEDHAPLYFYDIVADIGLKHLREEGAIYFEINQYLGEETVALLKKKGYEDVEIFKDLNAAERMIKASKIKR